MKSLIRSLSFAVVASRAALAINDQWPKSESFTPHDQYSSSIGVLGCKINVNRVAYLPDSITCDNICVQVSLGDRSVYLLHIDQSGGAYDISYDAWNYLQTGKSATDSPQKGGGVPMVYQPVGAGNCSHLFLTGDAKLPLSAANSMNYLTSCDSSTWVAQHHVLYNIQDPICKYGHENDVCTLDLSVSNQPSCANTLGSMQPLTVVKNPVLNVQYPTGDVTNAQTGERVSAKLMSAQYGEESVDGASDTSDASDASDTRNASDGTTKAAVVAAPKATSPAPLPTTSTTPTNSAGIFVESSKPAVSASSKTPTYAAITSASATSSSTSSSVSSLSVSLSSVSSSSVSSSSVSSSSVSSSVSSSSCSSSPSSPSPSLSSFFSPCSSITNTFSKVPVSASKSISVGGYNSSIVIMSSTATVTASSSVISATATTVTVSGAMVSSAVSLRAALALGGVWVAGWLVL